MKPLLSIIVPAYNEAATVTRQLDRVAEALQSLEGSITTADERGRSAPASAELIVVDDGSTDQTVDLLQAWKPATDQDRRSSGLTWRVLGHQQNRGKGANR